MRTHQTAGGVVLNARKQVLVLLRDVDREGTTVHEVRLPKGHIDPGETPEQAAVREVCEESGYCHLQIVSDLGTAISEYQHKGRDYRREERYFLMRLTGEDRGAAAPVNEEEALFEPAWYSLEVAETLMSYPSEREFIRRTLQKLASI